MPVLRVPSEYGSIEAAQNAAVDGDTVLLAAGTVQAPAVYTQPYSGIVKAIHLKNANETDPGGSKCIVQMYYTSSQHAAYRSCLAYRITHVPDVETIYVEGVQFRRPDSPLGYDDEATIDLSGATGLAGKSVVLNRCSIATNADGYPPEHVVNHHAHANLVFRNCYLTCYVTGNQEGYNVDGGELHLERTILASAPWAFDSGSSRKIIDTADFVSVATVDYGPSHGEFLAPWFMAENTFRYRGAVTVDGVAPGVALPVHLLRRVTGAFVATTLCDAGSGEYAFEIPAEEATYDHLIVSVGPDPTRPLAHWPINPELV